MRVFGLVSLAALACATVAVAAPNNLSGPVRGDDDATVSMKIVVKNGKPVQAKNVTIKDLDYTCQSSTAAGEKSANLGTLRLRNRSPFFDFAVDVDQAGVRYIISGTTKQTGEKVRGTVSIQFMGQEVGELCGSTPGGSPYAAKLR